MSKRRYKSTEFKKVDWNQVRGRIEGERVILGVDVAKEEFVATLLDADQTALLTFKCRRPDLRDYVLTSVFDKAPLGAIVFR